jgi:flagellar motor switch protein FliM
VSSNVESHEVEALLEGLDRPTGRRAPEVEARDFHQPRRMSGVAVAELRRVVEASLPKAEQELSRLLHGTLRLELGSAYEVNADRLFDALVRFDAGGHPAWAQWEIESAVCAVEQLLGAAEPQTVARELSALERTVLRTLIEGACRAVGSGLGLPFENFRAVAQRKAAGHWREAKNSDPHRLGLELHLQTPAGQSSLRIYVPIFDAQLRFAAQESAAAVPQQLPRHLGGVELAIGARLGRTELPLDQLLALQPGDVLTLDLRRGDPLVIEADGRELGRAKLGNHRGRLALRLLQLSRPEPPAPPARGTQK